MSRDPPMFDVVPSTSSAAVGISNNEMAYDTRDEVGSLHPSKTKRKDKVNVKINQSLNSTLICNKKTIGKDDQEHHTAQRAYNTNVIGTGPSYTGRGIKTTFHGVSYQMKLAMLYIVRGLQTNCQFEVATEVEEAGKLDDLLFLYEDNAIGFFQAKHRLNEDLLIDEKQLLSDEGDFSILKYFHSYREIINTENLRNLLKDRDMTLMLNTNVGIDRSTLNKFELTTASSSLTGNKIVALGADMERAEYYVINKCSTLYNNLVELLLEPGKPPDRVARNLAKAVVNNKKKSIKMDDLFDTHWKWLLHNVLDATPSELIKTKKRYFVTFKDSFFSTSESSVLNFQTIFSNTYLLNKKIGKNHTECIQEDLSGVRFMIPERSKIEIPKTRQDEVRKFLEILVFAVNQPNEIMLGDIIEKEIGDYVGHTDRQSITSKFKLYIQDWAKQKDGRYLTNKDMERQFALWEQETLNQIRTDDIKKYKCTFVETNTVIKSLLNFLENKTDANVFGLYAREMLFSKMKVCQALETFISNNIGQQFIFCDIKDLIELEHTKKCPVKAFSSQACTIFFISLQEGKLHYTEVLNRLLQIVIESNNKAEKPHFVKHLIISIPEKEKSEFVNKFCFNNPAIKSIFLDDLYNSFSELDETSRRYLMEQGSIKLNGNSIKSVLSENELSPYIRDKLLWKLITSELDIDDTAAVANHYYNEEVKQYYVNRSLVPIFVDQNITKDTRFHFVREDTLQTCVKNQEVIVVSSNEKLFEQFRKTNIIVHWLKETNGEYIWVTSQGTLSNIREYVAAKVKKRNVNYIPITNVNDLKNDVVLISAIPGMGKSILLSHIMEQSKKEDVSFFVFNTKLAGYFEVLYSLGEEENVTLEQAIHFAFLATQIESPKIKESESAFNLLTVQGDGSIAFSPNDSFGDLEHLRAMVFCNMYNNENIVLLLDGFDEIAPDYCKITLNLLHTLKHSKVHKMWITTRPYDITENLENDLETFAYTLKPLSEDNQLKLIKNLWGYKVKSGHTDLISSLKDLYQYINMSTLSSLDDAERTENPNNRSPSFMSVPLHCYMFAKVLIKELTPIDIHVTEKPFTIFDIYSIYVNIKFYEILYKVNLKDPKNKIFQEKKKASETDHGKLALLEIFDEQFLTELVPDNDKIELLTFMKSGNEKLGFVADIFDDRPRFVHRTFAEYFAAHYLAKIVLSPVENQKKEAAKLLLYNSITVNPQYYKVLFTFFNYIVVSNSKNKDIFQAAIAGNISILSKVKNVNEIFDPLNRTPMHLIAYNLFNVLWNLNNDYQQADLITAAKMMCNRDHNFIQGLCQSFGNHSTDTLFTWTPTHYLALAPFEYYNIALKLPIVVQYFSNVTQDILGRTPLMLLILRNSLSALRRLIAGSMRFIFHTDLNLNLLCVNTQDMFLKTALHYALDQLISLKKYSFTFEEIWQYVFDVICFLLKHGARIDIPDNQGITPLYMINSLVTNEPELLYDYNDILFNSYSDDVFLTCLSYIAEHVEKHVLHALNFEEFNTPDHVSSTALDGNTVRNLIHKGGHPEDADGNCRIKSIIKGPLKRTLLQQVLQSYDRPSLPVANSETFTAFVICCLPFETARFIIETTDMLTLSINNDNHKNTFIFLLNWEEDSASILISKFPHLVDVVDSRGRTALHYALKNYSYLNNNNITSLINSNARIDIQDNTGKLPAHINKLNSGKYNAYYIKKYQIDQTLRITTRDLQTLKCIDQLPFPIAKSLVLSMALFPPLTPYDHTVLNCVFDEFYIIASVLWAEYSDYLKTASFKEYYSYFDCAKDNFFVVCKLLEVYYIEDFSDNALKSNDVLKSVVELHSSIKDNNMARVETVLRHIETYSAAEPNDIFNNLPFFYLRTSNVPDVVNARSKDSGKTALHYAAEIGNAEIAQCLLSHGAWYNVPNIHGSTPAQVAKIHAKTAVLHLLEKIEVLSQFLDNKAYGIAASVVTEENNDGNIFHCVCFKTRIPFINFILVKENQKLLQSLVKHNNLKSGVFERCLNSIPLKRKRFIVPLKE